LLFNSYEFIFAFLPITFFIYFYLNNKRLEKASKGFLVFSSLFFYSWWNIAYLPIILSSMLFNYIIGNNLNRTSNDKQNKLSKKAILTFGIVSNIVLLGYFKYTDFFIENINLLTKENIPTLDLALPLAISFFTFQQISYLVDSYRQETNEYDFINYALFVTFFPQLIAGPIVHHKEMMPQFSSPWNKVKNYKNIAMGIFIFSIGLFKKVVIADTFAVWANKGFDVSTTLTMFEAWATSLSYTFQLYFDFSGYTDMAIGAALLFNIALPQNFNSPYKATSIQDFWRRWHMTLSRFLKDYVYIPLGGNRGGRLKTYTNLMATFIIGGIWHGAGWTFLFWGILHGLAISIERLWSNLGFKLWPWFAWLLTFNFVNIAWVFFRAKEWEDATKVIIGMLGLHGYFPENVGFKDLVIISPLAVKHIVLFENIATLDIFIYLIISIISIFLFFFKNTNELIYDFKVSKYYLFLSVSAFLLSLLFMNSIRATEFLYFDF